jgi:hypothetical protein
MVLFQILWLIDGEVLHILMEVGGWWLSNDRQFGGRRPVYPCTCEMRVHFSSCTSTGNFLLLQGNWKLNIAGHKSTPFLLASTELAIGNKLPYCLNRNL